MMKKLLLLVSALFFFSCSSTDETPAAPVKPIRALLLTGGCCHDYILQQKLLTEGMKGRMNIEWDVLNEGGKGFSHRYSIFKNRDWAKKYDVIVHNECFARMSDDRFITQVVEDHKKAGVGIIFIHCAMHTYRDAKEGTEAWRGLIGLASRRHEHLDTYKVENIASKHPIMQGFPKVWTVEKDELYKVLKTYEKFTPLARAYGKDSKQFHPCIWTHETPTNKSFGISMGHTNQTFESKIFLDTVGRGILWSCDKIQPNGLPTAGYEAKSKETP